MADTAYGIVRLQEENVGLLAALDDLHRTFFEGSSTPPEQFMDFVKRRLTDEQMLLILAMREAEAVGYGLAFDVTEHPFMPEWRRAGYITQLFVRAAHRGRGVGQLLVDGIMAWLVARGVEEVMLNVEVGPTGAAPFWTAQGFEPFRLRMRRRVVGS